MLIEKNKLERSAGKPYAATFYVRRIPLSHRMGKGSPPRRVGEGTACRPLRRRGQEGHRGGVHRIPVSASPSVLFLLRRDDDETVPLSPLDEEEKFFVLLCLLQHRPEVVDLLHFLPVHLDNDVPTLDARLVR